MRYSARLMTALSARLEMVLQLLRPCAVLADVGTDHALVPVAAVLRGVAQRAIAADLRDAPLLGARQHIERSGVADRVAVIKGNGLLPLVDKAVDAAVLAGMSGSLMVRLWDAAPHVLHTIEQLVVQPNQDLPLVRAWALRNGWHLRDERMLEVRGRFFTVCAFSKGRGADPAYAIAGWTEAALCLVGPQLLRHKDPVARKWYAAQRARLLHWVHEGVRPRDPELLSWHAACEFMR